MNDGGLLCVTCTDMAVLSGNNPSACFSRYGSMPVKGPYLHEMALRILLSSIEASANKHQRHITPIISCSIDFYVRVFVRVHKSAANVKESSTKSALVYHCGSCSSFHVQPRSRRKNVNLAAAQGPVVGDTCDQCGSRFKLGGPFWSAPIHDQAAVLAILEKVNETDDAEIPTKRELKALLSNVSEEVRTSRCRNSP